MGIVVSVVVGGVVVVGVGSSWPVVMGGGEKWRGEKWLGGGEKGGGRRDKPEQCAMRSTWFVHSPTCFTSSETPRDIKKFFFFFKK